MEKVTCIFGFDWTGEIVAEHDNTLVIECAKTKTRHVVRKKTLSVPNRFKYRYEAPYGRFKTKEDLFEYQKRIEGSIIKNV